MFKIKFSVLLLSLSVALVAAGCSPSTPEPSAAEKKAFLGGPMPKDFMKQHGTTMKGAEEVAQQARARDLAKHGQ